MRSFIVFFLLLFQFWSLHAQWYLSLSGKRYITKESELMVLPENGYQQGRFNDGYAQITGYKANFDTAFIDEHGKIVISASGMVSLVYLGGDIFRRTDRVTKIINYFSYDGSSLTELNEQEIQNILDIDKVIRDENLNYLLVFQGEKNPLNLMIHREPDDVFYDAYGLNDGIVRLVRAKPDRIFATAYLNEDNELIFPFVAGAGTDFENGMAVVSERYTKRMYIIGKDGNRIEKYPESKLITPFQQGLSLVEQNGLFGYMNLDGEWEIEPQYDFGSPFLDGYAAVTFNEKDSIQRFYSADNFSSLFNGQYSMGMYRIIDQEGNYVSDNWYAGLPKILPSGAAHVTILSEDGTRQYEALIDLENGGQIFDKGREKAARDYLSPY
jgi:hypothetical protein